MCLKIFQVMHDETRRYRYDPKTDTWTMVAPMSVPRDAVGVCVLGDRLMAVGGYDGQQYLTLAEAYDPHLNEWEPVSINISLQDM